MDDAYTTRARDVADAHLRQLRLVDGKLDAFDGDAAALDRPRRANGGHAGDDMTEASSVPSGGSRVK